MKILEHTDKPNSDELWDILSDAPDYKTRLALYAVITTTADFSTVVESIKMVTGSEDEATWDDFVSLCIDLIKEKYKVTLTFDHEVSYTDFSKPISSIYYDAITGQEDDNASNILAYLEQLGVNYGDGTIRTTEIRFRFLQNVNPFDITPIILSTNTWDDVLNRIDFRATFTSYKKPRKVSVTNIQQELIEKLAAQVNGKQKFPIKLHTYVLEEAK